MEEAVERHRDLITTTTKRYPLHNSYYLEAVLGIPTDIAAVMWDGDDFFRCDPRLEPSWRSIDHREICQILTPSPLTSRRYRYLVYHSKIWILSNVFWRVSPLFWGSIVTTRLERNFPRSHATGAERGNFRAPTRLEQKFPRSQPSTLEGQVIDQTSAQAQESLFVYPQRRQYDFI